MIYFVTYDATGKITGRIKSSSPDMLSHYDRAIVIDEGEYNAEPELHKKVDVETKKLVDK